ncbi:hypothetical protein BKA83DRAFT_110339, partial [Pisolithus microcarpus]
SNSQKVLDLLFPDEVVFGPISTGELFKNQLNFFPMGQVFKNLVDKGLYNEEEQRWSGAPDLSATAITAHENSLADFFNKIIECINNACGMVRPSRTWSTDSATCPLAGGGTARKPDMACWLTPGSEFDWRHLTTFAEVKNHGGKDKEKSSFIETAGKASCLLYMQDGHHAAPCFCILGSNIHLTIFDHSGSLSTCGYDINAQLYDFVCILVGITSTSIEILGFDTLIAWEWQECNGETVGIKTLDIHVDGIDLAIELNRVLFISNNLFGHGTMVWGGMMKNTQAKTREPVVVKDLWIDPLQKYTEGKILSILNMHKIEGVPTLICEQQVKAPNLSANAKSTVNSSTHFL